MVLEEIESCGDRNGVSECNADVLVRRLSAVFSKPTGT